ncbi:MAG: hypothetical protein COA78_07485 [Blastopirellula sp.]|nr:MAG: hypothetical protein COA78_07485 [Blastopirellula sp.]
MKLALIGANSASLELLASATSCQLVSYVEAGEYREDILKLFPQAKSETSWEGLLASPDIDAVIIAEKTTTDVSEDRLRKFVQEAVPVVLIHPACEFIFGLEMEMIRRDTDCKMITHVPYRHHSLLQRVRGWVTANEESPIGTIEQILFRRKMSERDQESVLEVFSHDAELLRYLLDGVTKITATGPEFDADNYHQLVVQLSGKNQLNASWSYVSDQNFSATVEFIGTQGTAELLLEPNGTITLSRSNSEQSETITENEAEYTLKLLEDAIQQRDDVTVEPAWDSIAHTLEIVDTVQYSLKRTRTIELRQEELSEQSTFKGMMAAGGCFLMLWSIFILFLAAFASMFDDFPLAMRINNYWPLALVTPLIIFLALQSLQLVFPRVESSDGTPDNQVK